MNFVTLSTFGWVNLVENSHTHSALSSIPDLDHVLRTDQKGGFESIPALEAARVVVSKAPLANRPLRLLCQWSVSEPVN
jgi:hypothetical protein